MSAGQRCSRGDEQEACLVSQKILSISRHQVVLWRGECGADAAHPETAADAVTALWKDRYLLRREVQLLSQTATTSWVEAALGGSVDRSQSGPAQVDTMMV